MGKKDRLELIIDIANRKKRAQLICCGKLYDKLRFENNRLDTLESYYNEYYNQSINSKTISVMHNNMDFIANIKTAISHQKSTIITTKNTISYENKKLLQIKNSIKNYNKIIDKINDKISSDRSNKEDRDMQELFITNYFNNRGDANGS